ncbi:MAG: chemotaxis-specific protein-glutamate methyltransferase CheB [Microcoleaceae cyanobacterium MO_207.B10]|nr:chemotaxis-specific protein-glutamate methyltransferase CheB [Microcoleaceae cyanobacterium MO_207.B10]
MTKKTKPVKILLVDDSPVALMILKRVFATSSEIEVLGTAKHGLEGLELIPKLQPDVICTDLHMSYMDGLEFTREVMQKYPRPILVISNSVQDHDTHNVFQVLEAGALDVFPKPETGFTSDYERITKELIYKIKILSGVKVFTHHSRQKTKVQHKHKLVQNQEIQRVENTHTFSTRNRLNKLSINSHLVSRHSVHRHHQVSKIIKLVVIGASTGGPQALKTIISDLPSNFPVPIICVQHISNGFLNGLVNWLGYQSKLPVKIAISGELPKPGVIYFPPEEHHLELSNLGKFVCSKALPIGGHRPSITVTFNSVALFYGSFAAGILLTGMGRDGADGMLAIAQAKGLTIAQDEATSVIFGMPKEAIALAAAQHILPITSISPFLQHHINKGR